MNDQRSPDDGQQPGKKPPGPDPQPASHSPTPPQQPAPTQPAQSTPPTRQPGYNPHHESMAPRDWSFLVYLGLLGLIPMVGAVVLVNVLWTHNPRFDTLPKGPAPQIQVPTIEPLTSQESSEQTEPETPSEAVERPDQSLTENGPDSPPTPPQKKKSRTPTPQPDPEETADEEGFVE